MVNIVIRDVKGSLQVESFTIKWTIERFFADCQNVGDYYESPSFPVKYANTNANWTLRIYPKGQSEDSKDDVSLFLFFASVKKIVTKVDYQMSIVSKQNDLIVLKSNATFEGPSDHWGQDAKQSSIRKHLINDTLIIVCKITFYPPDQDVSKGFHGYDKWLDDIGKKFGDYEGLLESGNFTDVMFNVQEKQIKSHKNILSYRSPVFKAMFEHEMKENVQNSVDITDIDYEVMKELFRFIYSGKVKNIEKIASDLLIAADKYQVIELKALCEKTLYDQLTVDNCVEYLKLCDVCDTIHLKRLIIKFVADHYKDVVKKPGFADLDSTVMYQAFLAVAEKE